MSDLNLIESRRKAHRRSAAREAAVALALSAAAFASGCGHSAPQEIEAGEPRAKTRVEVAESDAERFGFQERATSGVPAPEGWKAAPASAMRNPNFIIPGAAGAPPIECYVTTLAGEGGGLVANINRWRGQVGLTPESEAQIAALPKIKLAGMDATFVELTGHFTGMAAGAGATSSTLAAGATGSSDAQTLLGAMAVGGGRAVTAKMTGPSGAVAAQREKFLAFCASYKGGEPPAPAKPADTAPGAVSGAMPSDAVHGGLTGVPMGGPTGGRGTGASGAMAAAGAYEFDAPAGWKDAGSTEMRIANFRAGAGEAIECYAMVAGGSLEANVNRWRGQMGQPPLTPAELAKLPTIKILGKESPMAEIKGSFQGMSGAPLADAELFGAVCPLGADANSQSLFIKLTGPRAEVEKQRAAFLAFCASIRPRAAKIP